MSFFTLIIILYIVFYLFLAIVSAINERKRRVKIKESQLREKSETIEEISTKKLEIEEKSYPKEFKKEPSKETLEEENFEQKPTLKLEKQTEDLLVYKKLPSKLKKAVSLSKSDIIKGIIYKEILTPKFRKCKFPITKI